VPSADVVAWKYAEATIPSEQDIFSRPTPNPTQLIKLHQKGVVVEAVELVQPDFLMFYSGCHPDDGSALAATEPKRT
jgi:hypothetical protein